MGREYAKAHEMASDPSKVQQSGHKSETAWVKALEGWLPPQYQIGQRKYLLLEDDSASPAISAETDIVIFQPSYPERLRDREEILVSGVAAAFSVKLTLDRAGISEAIQQAAMVRRGTKIRSYSVVDEVLHRRTSPERWSNWTKNTVAIRDMDWTWSVSRICTAGLVRRWCPAPLSLAPFERKSIRTAVCDPASSSMAGGRSPGRLWRR